MMKHTFLSGKNPIIVISNLSVTNTSPQHMCCTEQPGDYQHNQFPGLPGPSGYPVHCVKLTYSFGSEDCISRNWAIPVLRNDIKCLFAASKQGGSWLILDLWYGVKWGQGSWSSLVQVKASLTAHGYYVDYYWLITNQLAEKYFQQI